MNLSDTGTSIESLESCPCCDSSRLRTLKAPLEWIDKEHFATVEELLRLSRCGRCGLVFINPRPSEQLLTSFYNKPGYDCHSFHFEVEQSESDARARFQIIERFIKRGLLLDFGPGAGHLLHAAQRGGWDVSGIELGQPARESLQREGFEVYPDLAAALGLRGRVDVVTMVHVLEHLADFSETLAGIRDLLQPEGVFYVEVPNAASLRARLSESFLKSWFTANTQRYLAFPIHLYYFSPRSLTHFLKRHGFEIAELCTLGIGVDELWARPQQPADEQANETATPPRDAAKSAPAYAGLKKSIKSGMSYLKLGENLVAVCRRAHRSEDG